MSKESLAQTAQSWRMGHAVRGPALATCVAIIGAGFRSLGPKLRSVHIGHVYLLEMPDHRQGMSRAGRTAEGPAVRQKAFP
jgi:hypothetical protein